MCSDRRQSVQNFCPDSSHSQALSDGHCQWMRAERERGQEGGQESVLHGKGWGSKTGEQQTLAPDSSV